MVSVKNENLVAHKMDANGEKGEILAVTPDLICIIDSDSGKHACKSVVFIILS